MIKLLIYWILDYTKKHPQLGMISLFLNHGTEMLNGLTSSRITCHLTVLKCYPYCYPAWSLLACKKTHCLPVHNHSWHVPRGVVGSSQTLSQPCGDSGVVDTIWEQEVIFISQHYKLWSECLVQGSCLNTQTPVAFPQLSGKGHHYHITLRGNCHMRRTGHCPK